MEVVRDDDGELAAIELTPVEMKELLAFEATCTCLLGRDSGPFLEDVRRHYDIPEGDMRPYFEKKSFERDDVWRLQILKRSAEGRYDAVHAIGDLRRLEARLGEGVLEACVERRRTRPLA
jgi:hypothetical protein